MSEQAPGVRAEYTPGAFLAVTVRRAWALIDGGPDVALDGVDLQNEAADLLQILEFLLRGGMRSLPSFAIVGESDARLVCLLRGSARAAVTVDGTSRELSAENAMTWSENALDEMASSVELSFGGGAGGTALPLVVGSVRATTVTLFLGEATETPVPPPTDVPAVALSGLTAILPDLALTEPALTAPPHAATPLAPPASGLIDSVPWASPSLPSHPASASAAPKVTAPLVTSPPPSQPTPAPSRVPVNRGPSPLSAAPDDDDLTLTISRPSRGIPLGEAVPADAVEAIFCPTGHPNPPSATSCRECRASLAQQSPVLIARPSLGVLRLAGGQVVTLDRSVVIGRSPSSDHAAAGDRPHLIKVESPSREISRNHVSVAIAGWTVQVEDLGSTNGTLVTFADGRRQQLEVGSPLLLEPGAVTLLGDGVSFTYETSA